VTAAAIAFPADAHLSGQRSYINTVSLALGKVKKTWKYERSPLK
jgi:hypothetical protein